MTYFGNEAPQLPGLMPFDGVALMSAAPPGAGQQAPGQATIIPSGMTPPGIVAPGMAAPTMTLLGMVQPGAMTPGPVQPTTEAMRQQAAAVIQRCYRWLEAAVPMVPQVAALAPVLVTAVQQYEAQQYPACLQQAVVVAQTAQRLHTQVPGLPPL